MAHKFEIIGEALVITDTLRPALPPTDLPKSEVYYLPEHLAKGKIYIHKINEEQALYFGNLNNAVDSTQTPFTVSSFEDFARNNLGFKTIVGGGGGGVITLSSIGSVTLNETLIHGAILNKDYAVTGLNADNPVTINWNGLVFNDGIHVSYGAFRNNYITIRIENYSNTTLTINKTITINN